LTAATNWLPSADEATEDQALVGALVGVQIWADRGLTAVNKQPKAPTSNCSNCFFMVSHTLYALIEQVKK
jgi:hypothetical protein